MNDAILSLIIASATGILTLAIRYAYYSKCDVIECCWCCKIHRSVINEKLENEIAINVSEPKSPNNNKNIGESKSFRI
jgi:hypothetical protein